MLTEAWWFDWQVIHALAVSLNKLGDLRFYADDLPAARDYYEQALAVRRDAVQAAGDAAKPSQVGYTSEYRK